MRRDILRPLQLVVPDDGDYRAKTGGGETQIHGDWEQARTMLLTGIETATQAFSAAFGERPTVPAVARVALKPEAFAKSHRPTRLFQEDTCPLIGSQSLGELFVSATPAGLRRLADQVRNAVTNELRANISTIQEFQPLLPIFDTGDLAFPDALEPIVRKVKLFNHRDRRRDVQIESAFREIVSDSGLEAIEVEYGHGIRIFELRGVLQDMEPLRGFVGMQSLGSFPSFTPVRTASAPVSWQGELHLDPPDPSIDYPVVAVLDDGVSPLNPHLAPWVLRRRQFHPDSLVENSHGTFVAGMLVFGNVLNHGDPRFPSTPCRILDVPIFAKGTPLTEQDLIRRLRQTVAAEPEVKVYNLSLSGEQTCEDSCFSDLAVALDAIQDEFDIQIVLAAGNYRDRFTRCPRPSPTHDCRGNDRVTAPSDSVNSIVVGSMAHAHRAGSAARSEEPSPFGRRGPGAMFLMKPDAAHYGGNTDANGGYAQTGVISLDPWGGTCESVGTSFATPIVSGIVAHLIHATNDRQLSTALLLHSASLRRPFQTPDPLRDFVGFGIPPGPEGAMECRSYEGTLVFDLRIPPSRDFSKVDFPIPACLVSGDRLKANWVVTLVTEPMLDSARGSEYVGIDASISIGHLDDDGRLEGQVPPEKRGGRTREMTLVKEGDKWSPRKGYRRTMPRGTRASNWGMLMKATLRSGIVPTGPTRVIALVTILDAQGVAPVYDDLLRALNRSGWTTAPMLQSRLRLDGQQEG